MKLNNSCLKLALAALMILLPGIAWGGTTYNYAATLTVKSTGNGKVYASDLSTLSEEDIVWQSSESTKTLENKGTTSTSWSPTLYAHAKAETGYEFSGWNNNENDKTNPKQVDFTLSSSTTTATQTFTASFSPISYTITYQLGGGTNNSSNPDTYTIETEDITLGNPTMTGYDFTGWTLESGGGSWVNSIGQKITEISKGNYGAITLAAGWKLHEYTIEYVLDDGTNSPNNPSEYNVTQSITLSEPSKEGFIFDGWTLESCSDDCNWPERNTTTTITSIPTGRIGNVKLKANWTKEGDPHYIKVTVSDMKKDDHAIFDITYGSVNQQIAIHEYAIVKIPGRYETVTVTPSRWTEKTYNITPAAEYTNIDVSSGTRINPTMFNFSATPKSGQNIFETSREF